MPVFGGADPEDHVARVRDKSQLPRSAVRKASPKTHRSQPLPRVRVRFAPSTQSRLLAYISSHCLTEAANSTTHRDCDRGRPQSGSLSERRTGLLSERRLQHHRRSQPAPSSSVAGDIQTPGRKSWGTGTVCGSCDRSDDGANRNRGDKLNLRECGIVQAPGL